VWEAKGEEEYAGEGKRDYADARAEKGKGRRLILEKSSF